MKLYVLATPIGNLSDLTDRAREALAQADFIAAEDTRVTMKLLSHLGLSRPLISCHRHNEEWRGEDLAERIVREDATAVLTCDAGTPAISDPGHLLVDACWRLGVPVEPLPGPSAVVTALSASGFDARRFTFHGFPPREKKPLLALLGEIAASGVPVHVLYESPHRVTRLAGEIASALPESRLAVCCDLTKKFEKITRGPSRQVCEALAADPNVEKGEYCLVLDVSAVPPPPAKEETPLSCEMALLARLLEGEDLAGAARALQGSYPRNELYRARLRLQSLLDEGRD